MTLREAAAKLRALAGETREVARRLEVNGADAETWAIGRDVNAIAFGLDRYAAIADRAAHRAEPAPAGERAMSFAYADPRAHWPVDHEHGE